MSGVGEIVHRRIAPAIKQVAALDASDISPKSSPPERVLEVNPVDLFAVEALRTFEPEVYEEFISRAGSLLITPENITKALIDAIKSKEETKNRPKVELQERLEALEKFFAILFPPVLLHMERESKDAQRICHPEFFHRYFELTVPQTALLRGDLKEASLYLCDPVIFLKKLQNWQQRSLLSEALHRLADARNGPPEDIELINAL